MRWVGSSGSMTSTRRACLFISTISGADFLHFVHNTKMFMAVQTAVKRQAVAALGSTLQTRAKRR